MAARAEIVDKPMSKQIACYVWMVLKDVILNI